MCPCMHACMWVRPLTASLSLCTPPSPPRPVARPLAQMSWPWLLLLTMVVARSGWPLCSMSARAMADCLMRKRPCNRAGAGRG